MAARLSNLLILAITLAIMANLGSIQTAWFISLLFGAGMGSVLVLRWLWERINLYSELAAIVASLITAPLLLVFMGTNQETEWIRLGTMPSCATNSSWTVGPRNRLRPPKAPRSKVRHERYHVASQAVLQLNLLLLQLRRFFLRLDGLPRNLSPLGQVRYGES